MLRAGQQIGTATRPVAPPPRGRGGFTLIEAVVVVAIIGLVTGLAIAGIHSAVRSSRAQAERQLLISLRVAVEQFKQEFNFLPPLVYDENPGGPVANGRPVVRPDVFLDNTAPGALAAPKFSEYSLTYYLTGALDVPDAQNVPMDGVKGPGFTRPNADGTFSKSGRPYQPFFDPSRDRSRLVYDGPNPPTVIDPARPELRDRWGQAIRYYRWKPTIDAVATSPTFGQVLNNAQHPNANIPLVVGDWTKNPALRDAEFAIVSTGPDKLASDDGGTADNDTDNIVEVGR